MSAILSKNIKSNNLEGAGPRELYHLLLHDAHLPIEALPIYQLDYIDDFLLLAPENFDQFWTAVLELCKQNQNIDLPTIDNNQVLLSYAPSALLDGCWLESWIYVEHSHTVLGAALLDAFFVKIGEGDAALHHGNLYRALLNTQGIQLPDLTSKEFIYHPRITDADFELALVSLRLGRRGIDHLPEILGFHIGKTILGLPPIVKHAVKSLGQSAFTREHREENLSKQIARRCAEAYDKEHLADWFRVWQGLLVMVNAQRKWSESLCPPYIASPWEAMIAMIEAKLPYAGGYHRHVWLEGKSLDDWITSENSDVRELLLRLASSSWIKAGEPDKSPFIKNSVKFGGPMFGVFTKEELAIVRNWIRILSKQPAPPVLEKKLDCKYSFPVKTIQRVTNLTLPELYHSLLNRHNFPESEQQGKIYTQNILKKAQRATDKLLKQELWPYSKECLQQWVDTSIHKQVSASVPGGAKTKLLKREDMIWILTQLAPAALVDGAWLQGLCAPKYFHTEMAIRLFEIYRDELGAGKKNQHHGNIMRGVLADLQIELPPCNSQEFSCWPGFVSGAFSMPVLWLSISQNSKTFQPELLGLNLAIEMAGIGSDYTTMITLLREHNINSYFFELHNTIDNASSGHTALSVQAIQHYMGAFVTRGDCVEVATMWRRIWSGFAAYKVASKPLVLAMAKHLGPKIIRRWIYHKFTRSLK